MICTTSNSSDCIFRSSNSNCVFVSYDCTNSELILLIPRCDDFRITQPSSVTLLCFTPLQHSSASPLCLTPLQPSSASPLYSPKRENKQPREKNTQLLSRATPVTSLLGSPTPIAYSPERENTQPREKNTQLLSRATAATSLLGSPTPIAGIAFNH